MVNIEKKFNLNKIQKNILKQLIFKSKQLKFKN